MYCKRKHSENRPASFIVRCLKMCLYFIIQLYNCSLQAEFRSLIHIRNGSDFVPAKNEFDILSIFEDIIKFLQSACLLG